MMTADKEKISLEHDATMCGDSQFLFLTKVPYSFEFMFRVKVIDPFRNQRG